MFGVKRWHTGCSKSENISSLVTWVTQNKPWDAPGPKYSGDLCDTTRPSDNVGRSGVGLQSRWKWLILINVLHTQSPLILVRTRKGRLASGDVRRKELFHLRGKVSREGFWCICRNVSLLCLREMCLFNSENLGWMNRTEINWTHLIFVEYLLCLKDHCVLWTFCWARQTQPLPIWALPPRKEAAT